VPCTEEDGSAPGQAFPCRWDADVQGNGKGQTYLIFEDGTYEYLPEYTN
jgi:hypothetical protein